MNIIENPHFAGVTRYNTLPAYGNKPAGWYVRERINPETGKASSLELGIYVNEETWLSIPVHFVMKHMFIPVQVKDVGEFKYYQLPRDIAFGVSKIISKTNGLERAILVPVDDEHPAVMVVCCGYVSDMAIMHASFEGDQVKVLKKFIDADRKSIAFIAFAPSGQDVVVNVKEGILNGTFQRLSKITFNTAGHTTDSDTSNSGEKLRFEYINMPMYIDYPKKAKNDSTDKDAKTADASDKIANNKLNTKEYRGGNKDNFNKAKFNKDFKDSDDNDEKIGNRPMKKYQNNKKKKSGGNHAKNRYQNNKSYKNNRRNHDGGYN